MENTNSDFKLNKEECKNLIAMIKSSDESNHEMAKTVLESLDMEDNIEWAFIIISFAGKTEKFWNDNHFYNELTKRFGSFLKTSLENRSMSLTLLNSVLPNAIGNEMYIELYLELYISEMKNTLIKFGYAVIGDLEVKKKV
jgi:hypothetical protein